MFLRGAAYSSTILQWLWLGMVSLPPLIKNTEFIALFDSPAPAKVVEMQPVEPSPILWGLVVLFTVVILIVTVIILIRIPRAIYRSGEKAIGSTARAALPVLTHHKPVTAKQRQRITWRITFGLQILACTLPFVISLLIPPYLDITKQIIITLAGLLAIASVIGFTLAWLITPKTNQSNSVQ